MRKLIDAEEIEGLMILEDGLSKFSKDVIRTCKFYEIPKVGILNTWNPFEPIYWLNNEKAYIPYMETNLIDSCNLNCKGCTHFANLFTDKDFYTLDNFRRDLNEISKTTDVLRLRLMGGEPLLLENLDQYVKVARKCLPKTALRLVTNGLLVPNAPQKLFDALRENKFVVDVSMYKPTLKMIDKISATFQKNNVLCQRITGDVETFNVFISTHGKHDGAKSLAACSTKNCRFLRDGKIYKCPVDALNFRFAEYFKLENYSKSTGVDIFSNNYGVKLEMLEGIVEGCYWCTDKTIGIKWMPENKPKVTDWLSDPEEIKLLESVGNSPKIN